MVFNCYPFSTEPTSLRNLTCETISDSEASFSWVDPSKPNGIILSHVVRYKPIYSNVKDSISEVLPASSFSTVLSELLPYTDYRFGFSAKTVVDEGPMVYCDLKTFEGREYLNHLSILI